MGLGESGISSLGGSGNCVGKVGCGETLTWLGLNIHGSFLGLSEGLLSEFK